MLADNPQSLASQLLQGINVRDITGNSLANHWH
jgi:hypothetical protein